MKQSDKGSILQQLYHYQRVEDHFKRLAHIYSRYPKPPSSRQREFLAIAGICEETLFGGAAGGGKTHALLMWLAEGVFIPGYNAIIFRKFQSDTKGDESALQSKSAALYPYLGGKLIGARWTFQCPGGGTSTITMGGIAHDNALLSVQGKEFHRVAFDERTHFTEMACQFVSTNRVRKLLDFPIRCGTASSANPGGPGHNHVKEQFITNEAIKQVKDIPIYQQTPFGMIFWKDRDTCYIPSRAADNPVLDVDDYLKRQLRNKNPVERARMMNGDWGVSPEGLIKPNWLRYYTHTRGQIIGLLKSVPDGQGGILHTDEPIIEFDERTCTKFFTVDTAGGQDQITAESKGKPASYSVIGVWDYKLLDTGPCLLGRYVWRDRVGFTEVASKLVELNDHWKPMKIKVEDATMGPHLVNMLRGRIPISCISTEGKDKVERMTQSLNMFEQGQIYLPKVENSWKPVLETEWLGWQGLKEETNDQIDITAYAGIEVGGFGNNVIKMESDPRQDAREQQVGRQDSRLSQSPLGFGTRGGFWS